MCLMSIFLKKIVFEEKSCSIERFKPYKFFLTYLGFLKIKKIDIVTIPSFNGKFEVFKEKFSSIY